MRPHPLGLVAIVVVSTLTACSPAYDAKTRDGLREHVVSVSEASAAGNWQAAIDELDVMTADLATAREDGKVDDDRFEAIVAAMELVRLDLEAAIAAAAEEAERQRLIEEQARLQQQIEELQNQGDDGGDGKGEKGKGDKEKDDDR
ncbi:MAG: hypothetical protein HOQ00_00840 [Agromyces sp.]|nr:hypothetical protein [Agromyces sp.]